MIPQLCLRAGPLPTCPTAAWTARNPAAVKIALYPHFASHRGESIEWLLVRNGYPNGIQSHSPGCAARPWALRCDPFGVKHRDAGLKHRDTQARNRNEIQWNEATQKTPHGTMLRSLTADPPFAERRATEFNDCSDYRVCNHSVLFISREMWDGLPQVFGL